MAALAPEESSEFDGQKVSDFGLQARDGRMLDVRDFRGRRVIVEFFASGSPACRAQLEQLIELHDRYAESTFALIIAALTPFTSHEGSTNAPSTLACRASKIACRSIGLANMDRTP
jgi:thiol-disulfide isomerase/thioredoxin